MKIVEPNNNFWYIRLCELKKQSKKTSDEIALESGIPKGTLNKLFAGQTKDPQLSTIKAVVHCLGHTLDDLDETIKKSPELTEVSPGDHADMHPRLKIYNEINTDGQDRLMEYAEDLSDMPKYKKCHNLSDEKIG